MPCAFSLQYFASLVFPEDYEDLKWKKTNAKKKKKDICLGKER